MPDVELNGKRLLWKSKAEETENDRLWGSGLEAGFRESKGSSCSRDCFRDEEMPEREEVEDVDVRGPGEEDARLASSRESRVGAWRVV